MDNRFLRLIATGCLLLSLCAADVAAQQQGAPAPADSLESLLATAGRLRAVERDPNTSKDRRDFNRELLAETERQLRPLLEAERRQWHGYLTDPSLRLSEERRRRVEAKVAEIDAELGQMTADARASSADPADGERIASGPATPTAQPGGPGGGGPGGQDSSSSPVGQTTGGQTTPAPGTAAAQNTVALDLDREIRKTAQAIQTARAANPNSDLAGFFFARDAQLLLAALVPQKATSETVSELENARTDKQIEGNEAQGGTTSLVSKGGVPAVLGFATANGALTRSVDGTTVTFRLNPVGLISTLARRGFISSYQNETGFERQLRNFALGLSFDTSRGDTGGVFTGSGQQLSGLSVRYNIVNRRDPRHRSYQDRFIELAKTQGVGIAKGTLELLNNSFNLSNPPRSLVEWQRKTNEALRAAPGNEARVLEEQLRKLPVSDLPPNVDSILASLGKSIAGFEQARDELLARVASGLILTTEYNLERRGELPDVSNFRFIAEKGAYDGAIDLTFNSSFSFFHSRPSGENTNRIRDFRFAGQLDVPLGKVETTGKFLLSFAGRYQRLLEDEVLPNGATLSAKGDIAVGQLKLTIPIRGTAFKIPLSVSFSNRTELLNEREIRGNFGFTFDLDSILARFNPFRP